MFKTIKTDMKVNGGYRKIFVASVMIVLSVVLIWFSENTSLFQSFWGNDSSACTNKAITRDAFFFDTYVSLTIYDSADNYSSDITSIEDINKLLDNCLEMCSNYENVFSRTNEASELYKLNNNPDFFNTLDITMSDALAECLSLTLDYSAVFGDKYSVMSGGLCDLWDFNNASVPAEYTVISNCISMSAYQLSINGNRIKLTFDVNALNEAATKFGYSIDDNSGILLPNPEINLGASAKGYIANKLCDYLKSHGINDAIIDLGGNIVVIGDKYDASMYKIGIKKPFSEKNESYTVCKVADMSVVTSGIYERYFENNGTIYHHIIDCSTGYPADNDVLSVTILSEDSLLADCYSTGCLLLGKEEALKLINNTDGVECIIIDESYNICLSDGLKYEDDYIILK